MKEKDDEIEPEKKTNSWDILAMVIVSLVFFPLAVALPADDGLAVSTLKFLLFCISILLARTAVTAYLMMFGGELLTYVLSASAGIAFMLLFAFWMIADKAGWYFLSVWAPVYLYFALSVIVAVLLHKCWTTAYAVSRAAEPEAGKS